MAQFFQRTAVILILGVAVFAPARGALAATMEDYLKDGWKIQGYTIGNSAVHYMLLQRENSLLRCGIFDIEVQCRDLSKAKVKKTPNQ